MDTPDAQWEVTGDIPEHIRAFIAAEVNSPNFPTPQQMQHSIMWWGQYPPPTTVQEDT